MKPRGVPRSNLLTVIAVAWLAYAADDLVHELLGHGSATRLLGLHSYRLSTVAFQTLDSQSPMQSRLLSAAGSVANILIGGLALLWLHRSRAFSPLRYFLWLFAFFNLMNGIGYPVTSAVLGSGDWAVVIAGLSHPLAWRIAMGGVSLSLYVFVVRGAAGSLQGLIRSGEVAHSDIARLTVVPYLACGALSIAASTLNPVGPLLILTSGAGASLGLMVGLVFIPGILKNQLPPHESAAQPLPLTWPWLIAAALVAVWFIAVLGPGILLGYS